MTDHLFIKGNNQIQSQDYRGAIATFTQLIEADPYLAEAYCRRAVAYFQSGNVHAAVSDYGRVLDVNSKHPKAYYGRALARFTLKNPLGALTDVNAALQWQSNYAAAYQLRVKIYRHQSNFKAAIADFKEAAKFYIEEQKADIARDCIQAANQIKAQLHQVHENQQKHQDSWTEQHYFEHVMNLTRTGETFRAMQDINWVLRSDPRDGKAYCCRGQVHLRNGQAREAIADFNQALALNFTDAMVYRSRGEARLHLGDFPGAIVDCNQALSIKPEAMSYVIRGNATRMMKDDLKALQDYDAALAQDPACGSAHFERGMTYEVLGKFQEAAADYQQAISLFCVQEEWIKHKAAQARLALVQKAIGADIVGTRETLSTRLYNHLLSLLEGSPKIAEAVLQRKRDRYPGHSEDWYIEAAIKDLEASDVDFWGKI